MSWADVSYFGSMMVHQGKADGMVSGAAHTTAHTIRPALEFIRTREGVSVVSSVFLMCLRDRVLVYGDCAVNPNPNAGTARRHRHQLGGHGGDLRHRTARRHALVFDRRLRFGRGRRQSPGSHRDRPLCADRISDRRAHAVRRCGGRRVARKKLPDSDVAGRATVFIFPDLNTGNNTYKAVQRSAGAVAIGPILQGLNKPVNDLSRGCTVTDIVNTVAVTAIQAQSTESES